MNGDRLFEALSHVGTDLIDRACETPAADRPKKARHPVGRRLAAIAGCACFLLVGAILFARFFPGHGNFSTPGLMLMAVDAAEIDVEKLNETMGFTQWTESNVYRDKNQPEKVEIEIHGKTVSGTYWNSFFQRGSLVPFHRYRAEDRSEFDLKPDGTLAQYSWTPPDESEIRNAGERILDEDALALARDLFEKLTPYKADDYSVSVTQQYGTDQIIEILFQKELNDIPTTDWAKIYLFKNGRPLTFLSCALGKISDRVDRSFDFESVDQNVMKYCDEHGLIDLINNLGYNVDVPDQAEIVIVDYSDWFHMLAADETGQFHVVVSVKIEYQIVRDGNAESAYLGLTFVSPSGEVHVISIDPEPPVEETGPSEGLTYASNGDGTCSVTGIGTFEGSRLEIPDVSPDGDTVTAIADEAFLQSRIEYLKLPDTVKTIGREAFVGCSLSKIDFGNGVAYIGAGAFNSNQYLTSLVIPDSVKTIDVGAFCWCTRLKNVSIGNGLITLEQQAFDYSFYVRYTEYKNGIYLGNSRNPYLVLINVIDTTCTSFKIHPYTQALAAGAFIGCLNLTAVTLPDGLIGIGNYAFRDCTSLQKIVIPSGVTKIPDHAFDGCISLKSVTLPDVILSVGREAFGACFNLTDFQLPSTVTEIGKGAFGGCKRLTSVTIPAGITEIPDDAFAGCSALTEVTIPASVTSIGYCAFYNCNSLTAITFASNGNWTIRYDDEQIKVYPELADVEEVVSTDVTLAENAENLTQTYVFRVWEKN